MVAVDTNIVVALFIRGRFSDDALKLQRKDSVWRTEPFALVEFSNVFATYQRARYLSKAAALERLQLAEEFLSPNYLRVSNQSALELALQYRVSAYDARFLAVADQLRFRLITEDIQLRTAAPALTQSLKEALDSQR
ncbi:MAG: PIN domain protein [Candidatus Udaeobacter sp.]|jgi:predicted nucleic acid-binding protein|nr:MAG: PIN domain protein [Candidatus Udaeobacter sp.]